MPALYKADKFAGGVYITKKYGRVRYYSKYRTDRYKSAFFYTYEDAYNWLMAELESLK